MTAAADLLLTNAEVHTLTEPDETAEAVAIREGRIVRVDSNYEAGFLEGANTEVIDLDGRTLLPGFIDAHTHMYMVGRYLVNADLRDATGPEECLDRLRADDGGEGWVIGYGFDESGWADRRYLTREDLDAVSADRPVAAFREDMHVASVNSVVLERYRGEFPEEDVRTEAGEPTGVLVEDAVDVITAAVDPDRSETRDLLTAAQAHANAKGVTAVHEMIRRSHAPSVYRELELEGELTIRVRINYWRDHLDAAVETGLRTNHGGDMVRVGGIKTYTDGSLGGRTAKLAEPYADGEGTGQWVLDPDAFDEHVAAADSEGFQLTTHAIGDAAIEAVVDGYAEHAADPEGARHRIEHVEVLTDELIERLAETGVVASVQPNFLKWAREDGLYEARLGRARTRDSNRYATLLEAGVPLAFGSDCMPLDPLFGVHQAVNAPAEAQRLSVTEAVRAYTSGAAYAGFDEDRLGTVEPGKRADLVALERSPWEHPGSIEDIDVALTLVDGTVVHDARD